MSSSPWTWDPGRQKYYYYSREAQAWIYEDGETVFRSLAQADRQQQDPRASSATASGVAGHRPRTESERSQDNGYGEEKFAGQFQELQLNAPGSIGLAYLSSQHNQPSQYQTSPDYQQAQTVPPLPQSLSYNQPSQYQPSPYFQQVQTADAPLPQSLSYNQGSQRIRPQLSKNTLDPHYKRVDPRNYRSYFKPGRVFKALWPEPTGASTSDRSSEYTVVPGKWGEGIMVKIRWFMVVQAYKSHSLACRISTYGGQGVSKSGLDAKDHAALFVDGCEEKLLPGEEAKLKREPLHLHLENKSQGLDPAARIDFSRVFTIEHNIKVFTVGRIVHRDLQRMKQYFEWSLSKTSEGSTNSGVGAEGIDGEVEEPDDDPVSDDDDGEEDDHG